MSILKKECRVLFDVCNTRLYHDNLFHLTGLPVDATLRDVARRQDDLKAAEMAGDWDSEFRHIMTTRGLPEPGKVHEAFLNIQDPERRIVEELFWFWPVNSGQGKHDPALQYLRNGDKTKAYTLWKEQMDTPGIVGLVAKHNLAVMFHFYAIDYEFALDNGEGLSSTQKQTLADYWRNTITYWESMVGNDDFWALMTERVRTVDDPRLTTGFVRRLRNDFPLAFDRINAQLAIKHASKGRYTDARRHVGYMKETHAGLDDVESTISEVLEPMEKKIAMMSNHAITVSQKNPEKGLQAAEELLSTSKEPLAIAKGLLDEGHSVRSQLFDLVAAACFGCLIAYGNKTEDWLPCVKLLQVAESMAVTQEFKNKVRENLEIAKRNHVEKTERETCWFCKKIKADDRFTRTVKMYGELSADYDQNCHWKHITIEIPRCHSCSQLWNGGGECSEFKAVKTLKSNGWYIGEKPSEDEMRRVLGLPSRAAQATMKVATPILAYAIWVGAIMLIGFIGSIAGCH